MTMPYLKSADVAAGKISASVVLDHLGRRVPVIGRTLKRWGEISLSEYVETLCFEKNTLFQEPTDLAEVVKDYLLPVSGETVANRAANELIEHRLALTGNHHGVDCFAQSVQGSLISALPSLLGKSARRTVVVLACGNIPLNNLTYPQGFLFYRPGRNAGPDAFQVPKRLPLFPNSLRRVAVCAADSFDRNMVERAGKKIVGCEKQGDLDPLVAREAVAILNEDYLDPAILDLSSYSLQASILNTRLWKRMFGKTAYGVDLAWIELEEVAAKLAIRDMNQSESLLHQVLFDDDLRARVLNVMNGERICWRNNGVADKDVEGAERPNGYGTVFFWGIDSRGLKVPLAIEANCGKFMRLAGTDSLGDSFSCQFTASAMSTALDDGRLVPSLFTCYLAINFARGVACVGGYYQAQYLPAIQKKLVSALAGTGQHMKLAETVQSANAGSYLSGMQSVMHRSDGLGLLPAGPFEIAGHHGLNEDDLERMGRLSLREAHCASLLETLSDIVPEARLEAAWKRALAADLESVFSSSGLVLAFT